jgi:hypothetical protein
LQLAFYFLKAPEGSRVFIKHVAKLAN